MFGSAQRGVSRECVSECQHHHSIISPASLTTTSTIAYIIFIKTQTPFAVNLTYMCRWFQFYHLVTAVYSILSVYVSHRTTCVTLYTELVCILLIFIVTTIN